MSECTIVDYLRRATTAGGAKVALVHRGVELKYEELSRTVAACAGGLINLGTRRLDRVAVFLEKRFETVEAILGTLACGRIVVPINPQLKPAQVRHVLADSGARVLITSAPRAASLGRVLPPGLTLVLCDGGRRVPLSADQPACTWAELLDTGTACVELAERPHLDSDPAAILYTSGSTGAPKGVVLSHRNLTAGALSVNEYLRNGCDDVILGLLPLSFDAGLSQLTTSIVAGAQLVLLDFLMPAEAADVCAAQGVTCITAVPPLWHQLASVEWPAAARARLRLFANTGGHMPRPLLTRLRELFPAARPYLMYGLTESFRSTYLDPSQVDNRPDSIGKAVPNAEILVLRPDGTPCEPGEPGELVHRGAFVTLGYWNDPERTAQRYRPIPQPLNGGLLPAIGVWSGDIVRQDCEGFLYFIERRDEMIKSSGYRISPTEVEEAMLASNLLREVAAFGVPHPELGQAIMAVVVGNGPEPPDTNELLAQCRRRLPGYMIPKVLLPMAQIPRNPNGKYDRAGLAKHYREEFARAAAAQA